MAWFVLSGSVRAAPTFAIALDDPAGRFAEATAPIRTNLRAAADALGALLPSSATISIVVRADESIPRATGRSAAAALLCRRGGRSVFLQGAAAKCLGVETLAAPAADIEIALNPLFAREALWYDPLPRVRVHVVPSDRIDAVSVFTRELLHAFAFNGWANQATAALPPTYCSTFDERISIRWDGVVFLGPRSSRIVPGGVPLTFYGIYAVGNERPGIGADLLTSVMNGVSFEYGRRYRLTALEVAMLNDAGLPTLPLCPGDATFDGVVNFDDLLAVMSAYGSQPLFPAPQPLEGDVTGDSTVDFADMSAVLAAYGTPCENVLVRLCPWGTLQP